MNDINIENPLLPFIFVGCWNAKGAGRKAVIKAINRHPVTNLVLGGDNFYPTNIHQLKFYNEIYNTQTLAPNEQFLLTYFLEFDGGAKLNSFIQQQKISAKNVIINLGEFDITDLQSGSEGKRPPTNPAIRVRFSAKPKKYVLLKKGFFHARGN